MHVERVPKPQGSSRIKCGSDYEIRSRPKHKVQTSSLAYAKFGSPRRRMEFAVRWPTHWFPKRFIAENYPELTEAAGACRDQDQTLAALARREKNNSTIKEQQNEVSIGSKCANAWARLRRNELDERVSTRLTRLIQRHVRGGSGLREGRRSTGGWATADGIKPPVERSSLGLP